MEGGFATTGLARAMGGSLEARCLLRVSNTSYRMNVEKVGFVLRITSLKRLSALEIVSAIMELTPSRAGKRSG